MHRTIAPREWRARTAGLPFISSIYIYTRYDVLFFYGVPQLDINMDSNTVVGNSNTEPHVGFDFHFARYFPALQRYFLVSSLQTSTAIGL